MPFLHRFRNSVRDIEPPANFNNPFYYSPHRLCVIAAEEVRALLQCRGAVASDAAAGKMMGVLVVCDSNGKPGFLAAFSGLLAGSNSIKGFVPPVFDFLSADGYFKKEEGEISELNRKIKEAECGAECQAGMAAVAALKNAMEQELAGMKENMRRCKRQRDALRAGAALSAVEEVALVRESQFQKAELKRATAKWRQKIAAAEEKAAPLQAAIVAMKEERKRRSAALQEWLFGQFKVLNARGEEKSLLEIFAGHSGCLPPAGAGECAAPKLLQYAYLNGLRPVAMAEFWVGASPVGEVRRDGCFYGSCKSKCEPILGFMLQGLDVEDNALEKGGDIETVEVVYEDEYVIVVNKPHGVLSVPGIVGGTSVQQWLRDKRGNNEVYVVHRLDMATSGLLVAAKSIEVYKELQGQFALREVYKEYTALLDGVLPAKEGTVSLPLAPDYSNRPRQRVDSVNGKAAITHYNVLETVEFDGKPSAMVLFVPITGRTHQLRVHAAHALGLNCPIVGDTLYGNAAGRLMLHASRLKFRHPASDETVEFVSKVPFCICNL